MDLIKEFDTPLGLLCCTNKNGEKIFFSAVPFETQYDTTVYDLIASKRVKVKPTYQSVVSVLSDTLQIGETYTLRLIGNYAYQYGNRDENTICNVITENNISLSLGAYDPNDAEKDRQWVPVFDGSVRIGFEPPEQYDTSKFKGYILSVLPDWSGFSFQLLDRTLKKIEFRLAWIRHTIEAEISDYENIVTHCCISM